MRPFVSEAGVAAVVETLQSGWIGQGPKGAEFERRFADRVQAPHACAVSTCAAGLRLALALGGVGPGDEVITTPLTWQATNHPILEQFATPVFADVQPDTLNLDPQDVARRITGKTRAIICPHWGGYPADLEALLAIAAAHDLVLIEEAAEALGATYRGRPIGGVSRFTSFSFYAFQTLTSAEGGMLTMQRSDDADAARRRRWFGIDRVGRVPSADGYFEYDTWEPGYGYHMTDVLAALGLSNLSVLDELLSRRRTIAARYRSSLGSVDGVTLLRQDDDRVHANGLFTILVDRRADFRRAMLDRGVESGVVHVRTDQYSVFGGRRTDLPGLDAIESSYLCLPMHNRLTDEDVDAVISAVGEGW